MEDVTKSVVYELGTGVPRTANVLAYASVIRDKALLRSLRDIGARLQTQAESALAKGVLLLEEAEQAIFGLSATSVKSDWVSGAELAAELYPVIEQLTKQRTALTGVASGFRDLDRLTRGFQPGDLILLGEN